jgi:prolyl-tRNA synthetase
MTAAMNAKVNASKETKVGITVKKEEDFSGWYTQVLLRSEMMDYYDVSGCYILRPWCYKIWKQIQAFLGGHFESLGVEDAYFPLFISQNALQKEKDHVEGFAPEVAWVTRSGSTDLPEPIAVRPTSETVMYPAYAKWIQSHRDLPLKMNQWCNVVRWEFKHPQPFLRSREFLWQEGHTCFNTKEEADTEVLQVLEFYRRAYEELLAVPMIKGMKSEKEKFAGALYTTTIEGFIPSVGRGIQGATSHCLGQNFSKMFKIAVEGKDGEPEYVWQNSWGFTTRSIGVMVMTHADNNGLVLPPRVASIQIVIVPVGITAKTTAEEEEQIRAKCENLVSTLEASGIRAKADLRDNVTPGWKFNQWELKGVPVRFEIGPKELASNQTRACIRFNSEKRQIGLEGIVATSQALLEEIHEGMFAKAKAAVDAGMKIVEKWDDFVPALDAKCRILIPWCQEMACEDAIKERSAQKGADGTVTDERAPAMGAKSLCIPFEQPAKCDGKTCVQCGKPAKGYALFGRSY